MKVGRREENEGREEMKTREEEVRNDCEERTRRAENTKFEARNLAALVLTRGAKRRVK